MKEIRPSIFGMALAVLITAIGSGLWALGHKYLIAIALWPGMILGWLFIFGDNINSFDEVLGIITIISLVVNGAIGFSLGALTGRIIRLRKQTH